MRWLNSITDSIDINSKKLWEIVKDKKAWHAVVHRLTKTWTQFSDWTTATNTQEYTFRNKKYSLSEMLKKITEIEQFPPGPSKGWNPTTSHPIPTVGRWALQPLAEF